MAALNPSQPTFDEWVDYCFTQGYANFKRDSSSMSDDEFDELMAVERYFCEFDPTLLANYITRLFRTPAFLAERYSDRQLTDGFRFMFGCASQFFPAITVPSVPVDMQIAAISSVATLYTELFDRLCCDRGRQPAEKQIALDTIDAVVFMIWDMGGIDTAALRPIERPHLVDPAMEVLETALMRCRTSTCVESALHGLGHIGMLLEVESPELAARALSLIDRFLARTSMPDWLREYATRARQGMIQ